jgi:uncharacterized phage protein (TIGR01671 family)
MRTIKFRAWAFTNKKMYLDIQVGGFGQTVPAWYNKEKGWVDLWGNNEKDGVIMQFTGLTDKNGKEIYEGDILSRKAEVNGKLQTVERKVVKWSEKYLSVGFNLSKRKSGFEVIGNVWANPELLK